MSADPMTIMMITSAVSSVVGGISQRNSQNANASVMMRNAQAARQEGQMKQRQAEFERKIIYKKGEKERSSAVNIVLGKGGVDIAGSPEEAIAEMAFNNFMDQTTRMYQGELDMHAAESQAASYEYQARLMQWQGKQAMKGAVMGAGMSLVGAAWSGGMFDGIGKTTAFQPNQTWSMPNFGGTPSYPSGYNPIRF